MWILYLSLAMTLTIGCTAVPTGKKVVGPEGKLYKEVHFVCPTYYVGMAPLDQKD